MIDILVDRSRHELSQECEREYWWTYHAYGTGITPKGKASYFVTGEAIHVGIQCSMLEQPWDKVKAAILAVFEGHEAIDAEQRDLAIALTYAWTKQRRPQFLQEYRPFVHEGKPLIEREIVVPIHQDEKYRVLLMSRPDIIVERLLDGAILVWELKSTGVATDGWLKKWEHALQLLLQCYATQSILPERQVVGIVVEGFVKGQRKRDLDGLKKVSNSLIYGYVKRGDGFIIPDAWTASWKKGWTKALVSASGPLEQWIDSLSEETIMQYLRIVPPLLAAPDAVASVCRQVAARAIQHYEAAAQVGEDRSIIMLDRLFPQNFNNCLKYGEDYACDLRDVCFQHTVGEDPLASGLFVPRVANHEMEKQ